MRRAAVWGPALLCVACGAGSPKPALAPTSAPPPATNAAPAPAASSVGSPTQSIPSTPGASSLAEPDWLPIEAREMLSARMDRHGEEMMLLLVSVMTLHHEDTELLAEQVAVEPQLGRPAPGEKGTLNALLPPRFFGLQAQLVERAHAVAAAARSNDNARIVRAYGQLAETCVSCHSVYLKPDTDFEGSGD